MSDADEASSINTSSWFQLNDDDTTKQQLGYILENKDGFEKLHKELGDVYLTKFVINLRSCGMQTEETWAPESDTVFINLLKMLLEKRKEKLVEFAKNLQLVIPVTEFLPNFEAFLNSCNCAEKKDKSRRALVAVFGDLRFKTASTKEADYFLLQLKQCLSLSLRSAGALVQLSKHWNTSPQKDVLWWKPPEAWSHPVDQSEPFETYLKARWGQKLPGLLGLQVKHIGWWNAPSRPKDIEIKQSSDAARAKMTHSKSGNTKLAATQQSTSKVTKVAKLKPQTELKTWLPNQYERGDSFDPYYKQGILGGDFFGLFRLCPIQCKLDRRFNVEDPCNSMDEKWELELVSICPALTGDLGNGQAISSSQAKLSTWSCLWQHTSDYKIRLMQQRMHSIMLEQWDKRVPGYARSENEVIKDWMEIMARSAGYINKVRNERGDKNETKQVQEILLQPHLLAQLPWNSTMLQSWLIAALITIQKFEIESLELRHWPMHPEIEVVARELLALVCHAKERVLFVLALYFKMVVKDFEQPCYYQLILKEGLLPALPALELLSSGKGSQLLLEIKSIAWSQSSTKINDNMIFMNPEAYNPLPQLDTIYLNMMWHVKYWLTTDQDAPYPSNLLEDMYPLEVLAKLSKGKVPLAKSKENQVNSFSVQERGLFEFWYNPNADYYWMRIVPTEKLLAMTEEALKRVKQEGWFSELSIKSLSETYLSPTGRKCGEALRNVKGPENKLSLEMQIAIYGSFHLRFLGSLYGIHRRTEEFGWLVRLSGELLEREQLVRTGQIVSLYHGIAPQLQGCYPHPRSCAQLLESVQSVASQRDLRTLDWLWSQLPDHWQQPVSHHVDPPVIENGVSGVITQFEARLGAILGGVVKESLRVLDKGGSMFPNWQVTQCLIPIYLGDLKACAKSNTAVVNLSKLIHQLLSNLEEEFLQWSTGISVAGLGSGDRCDSKDIDPDLVVPVANVLLQQLDTLLYTYVARHANLNTLPGFQEMTLQLRNWWSPMPDAYKKVEGELIVFRAWFKISIEYITLLLQACQKAWNVLIPEPITSSARCLKSLYFLSCVSEYIECALDIFLLLNKYSYASTKKPEWRKKLMIALSDSEDRDNVVVKEKEMWSKFSKTIQSYRDMKDKFGTEYFPLPYWSGSEAMSVKEVAIALLTGTPRELDQLEIKLKIFTGRICSNLECSLKEEAEGTFLVCESCISCNSPNINAYCSEICEKKWWKLEHMAQHLEQELDIA